MNTKLILQAATTFLVLSLGSGLLPAGMGAAEAFQSTAAAQAQTLHATQNGVPEDFIFASGYTWIGR